MAPALPENYCRGLVGRCLVAMFIGAIGIFLQAVFISRLENPDETHNAHNTDGKIDEDNVKFETKIESKGEK